MTGLGIAIIVGISGAIVYGIVKSSINREKRNKARQKLDKLMSDNKILKNDYNSVSNYLQRIGSPGGAEKFEAELMKAISRKKKQDDLISQYGSEVGLNIFHGKTWIGMTKAQLLSAKGQPDDKDKEVMKTKTRENYYYYLALDKKKYNTYTLENDELTKIFET